MNGGMSPDGDLKMKTCELTGAALDWAVAKFEGIELTNGCYNRLLVDGRMSRGQEMLAPYNPSTDWSQGGPIIEREGINAGNNCPTGWQASKRKGVLAITGQGPTPLIAAMRCYVASKCGESVSVPEGLE